MNFPKEELSTLCADIVVGHVGPSSSHRQSDGVPFLMGKNIGLGFLKLDDLERVTPNFHRSQTKSQLQPGDVVVVRIGQSGQAAKIPEALGEANCAGLVVIKQPSGVTADYLVHFLNSPEGRRQSLAETKGSTRQTLNTKSVAAAQIPVPSLATQRRITEILDRAETLRAKRRAALAQLDTVSQSIFLDLHRQAHDVSREVRLVDVAEATRGSFVNGPFGSDLLTRELQNEGVPVVYIRDIRDGEYRRVSTVCVSEEKANDLSVCSVRPGDVLVAKVGDPPGVAARYPENEPIAVVTQDVIRIRLASNLALPEFIVSYLNSSLGRLKVSGITIEATRARFSLGEFKQLTIALPPLSLQKGFARQATFVAKLKTAHRASLAELDALVAVLQHQAFRGEV